MSHPRQPIGRRLLPSLAILLGAGPTAAVAQWTAINLHPAGAIESRAFGVYDAQQVGAADFGSSRGILWLGAASSFTDLHPAGGSSDLVDVFDGRQFGNVHFGASTHASLWTGSPASWVDIHPAAASSSFAEAIGGHSAIPGLIRQVGSALVGGVNRASLWSGTAASWVDLHPAGASFSIAYDIDDDQQVGMAIIGGMATASLWTNTAASWVSLHPVGAVTSRATGADAGQQVGSVDVGGNVSHASLWTGTAASWVDLHPPAGQSSEAHAVHGGRQVGEVRIGGFAHASIWSGSAATWIDLHSFLGPQYTNASSAYGVWTDGTVTHVAGYAFNTTANRYEAILWVESSGPPANDDCTAAQSISDGTRLFSNLGATTDGPPEPSCLPPEFNGVDDSDIWYEYVAGCEGNVNVEVHRGNYDSLIGVYSGSCGGQLLGCGSTSVARPLFAMSMPAVPGETFQIRLGGVPGMQGMGSLTIQCVPSLGACCDPASVCTVGPPSACQAVGGTYYGDGLTCASTVCPPPPPQIDFLTPTTVGTGDSPFAVAPGDFDQDGDNDLAVCDFLDQTYTVLHNDGSGSFQFAYAVSLGNVFQQDAVAADLDGDGDLDLAIAAEGVVLHQNVGGALGSWVSYSLGTTDVREIIAEDFDGDCTMDLATANSNPPGNNISVLLNVNGDFTAPTITHYTGGSNPTDLASADMNQDGFPDIVAANAISGDLTVFYNNGSGNFSSSANFNAGLGGGCCLTAVGVGDLNGDLFPDAVVSNSNTTQVSVMMNNGAGGFLAPSVIQMGNGPWDVEMADLDGDGDRDVLVVITNFPYQLAVLTNDGSGSFYTPLVFDVGTGQQKLAVAHLNASTDGALDVAVPRSAVDEVALLFNISEQDCNNNSVPDHTEPISSLNFVITGTSNATPCSFRAFGSGFDVRGEFCAPSGAGGATFVDQVIARLNQAGCPGIRAQRINGLSNGFTVFAPGNSLDFCIGSPPGLPTCCFSSSSVCSCNPDIEQFFLSGEDCNANGMDDTIDIYGGTSTDLDGNGIPDECGLLAAPLTAPPPHDSTKSRYIAFDPNAGGSTLALEVSLAGSPDLVLGWVDVPDANGIARLTDAPLYREWPEQVVFVGDCDIAPANSYRVRASADGSSFSAALVVETTPEPGDGRLWGDVVGTFAGGAWTPPNGLVNGFDITAVLRKFQVDPTAAHITWMDLNPQVPDKLTNGADILQVVNAFGLTPYPFVQPPDCP